MDIQSLDTPEITLVLRDVSDTAYVAVRQQAFHLPISRRNLDILCIHVDDTEIHV